MHTNLEYLPDFPLVAGQIGGEAWRMRMRLEWDHAEDGEIESH